MERGEGTQCQHGVPLLCNLCPIARRAQDPRLLYGQNPDKSPMYHAALYMYSHRRFNSPSFSVANTDFEDSGSDRVCGDCIYWPSKRNPATRIIYMVLGCGRKY
jgi:hypothetical protein